MPPLSLSVRVCVCVSGDRIFTSLLISVHTSTHMHACSHKLTHNVQTYREGYYPIAYVGSLSTDVNSCDTFM